MRKYDLSIRNLEKKSEKSLLSGRNFFIALAVISSFLILYYHSKSDFNQADQPKDPRDLSFEPGPKLKRGHTLTTTKRLIVKKIDFQSDQDGDGINDLDDIVRGARKAAKKKAKYKSAYYAGGYPPAKEGVCTDVIWRAFKEAGYNLKNMVDRDIQKHVSLYPGVNGNPDPNIDFRRVVNLKVFFERHGRQLTLKLIPWNRDNLKEWQGGDIVQFDSPSHIAIVSNKRRADGVPYLIHNEATHTMEADDFMAWRPYITGHYRFPKR